jgi:polysaccharide pyruvyl transferase WcaK-like protein
MASNAPDRTTAELITLFGLFGGTNLGNEATLASCLAAIAKRRPEAALACVGLQRERADWRGRPIRPLPLDPRPLRDMPLVHRLSGRGVGRSVRHALVLATERGRAVRARALIGDTSLFLVPGTGIVDDFGQGALDLPAHLLRWCDAARARGGRVALLSIGASRVEAPAARERFVRALALADYVTVRDEVSQQHLIRLGCARAAVVPDLAFGLPRECVGTLENFHWPPRCVGLGVMGYRGWNVDATTGERIYSDYVAKLTRAAHNLLAAGLSLRLLHGDTLADVATVCEIAGPLQKRYGAERVTAERVATFEDAFRELRRVDALIASRYHNVLFALLLGLPVISLSYGDKNDALMADFGLSAYCLPIEEFSVERLIAQFQLLQAMPEPPTARIARRLAAFRARVEEQYDAVLGGAAGSA